MKTFVYGTAFAFFASLPWAGTVYLYSLPLSLSLLGGIVIGISVMNITIHVMGFKEFGE